jgi:hypothetical protein
MFILNIYLIYELVNNITPLNVNGYDIRIKDGVIRHHPRGKVGGNYFAETQPIK